MLHKILSKYLAEVEKVINSIKECHVEKYEEEILSNERVNIRIRIRLFTGHLLEINESIIIHEKKFQHLNYRYHFQKKDNQLIFRYDNTPDYPELPTFPNHKHIIKNIIQTNKPSIAEFITEIQKYLFKN